MEGLCEMFVARLLDVRPSDGGNGSDEQQRRIIEDEGRL